MQWCNDGESVGFISSDMASVAAFGKNKTDNTLYLCVALYIRNRPQSAVIKYDLSKTRQITKKKQK